VTQSGQWLLEIKSAMADFDKQCDIYTTVKIRQRQRYMKLAKEFPKLTETSHGTFLLVLENYSLRTARKYTRVYLESSKYQNATGYSVLKNLSHSKAHGPCAFGTL
jgi:hypothetical protein